MHGNDASFPCGAAFSMTSGAKEDLTLPFDDFEIEMAQGQRDVVVRLRDSSTSAEAHPVALDAVQRGLDMASILGRADVAIIDADDDYVLWWTEPEGPVVRVVSTITLAAGVGSVNIVAKDAEGNIIPPVEEKPQYSPAFRYFRLAQIAEDLFEAYRNMYLAFEALLSSRYPRTKRERAWIEESLREAASDIQIANLVPEDVEDPVEALVQLIYVDARLPLFHAKHGEKVYLPYESPEARATVTRALGVLTTIVLRLSEAWFGTRRMGGGLFLRVLHDSMRQTLADTWLVPNGDVSTFDINEDDLNHERFASAPRLQVSVASDLERDGAPALLAKGHGDDIRGLEVFRRMDLIDSEKPLASVTYDSDIGVRGVARLELLLHVRGLNASEPKIQFRQ